MIFEETVSVRMSDCDRTGKLSYEGILQVLETAGSHHSDAVGDNMVDSSRAGIAWIIADWRVAISRRPETGESLHIATWVRGKAPSSVLFREFRVTDSDDRDLIRGEARLTLVNTETGRIIRITQDRLDTYGAEADRIFPDEMPRLWAPETWDREQPLSLRHSDIDYNGHVHNTRYVSLAQETQDSIREYQGLSVHYGTPILEGSTVTLRSAGAADGEMVGLCAGDKLCALVRFEA